VAVKERGSGPWHDLRYEWRMVGEQIQVVVSGEREPMMTTEEYNLLRKAIFDKHWKIHWLRPMPVLFRDTFSDDPQ
jgi:hypothetical protein